MKRVKEIILDMEPESLDDSVVGNVQDEVREQLGWSVESVWLGILDESRSAIRDSENREELGQ